MDTKTLPYGISLCVKKAPHTGSKQLEHGEKHLHLDLGWVNLTFKAHSYTTNHYLHKNQIHIILDGYISTKDKTLENIVFEFLEYGASSISKLKGSFALCFIDISQNSISFFSDKKNSRSYFLSATDNEIHIATRVDFLAHKVLRNNPLEINKQAVIQYLIKGAFYSNHTLFTSICKIAAATELIIRPGTISTQEYWTLQYKTQTAVSKYTELELIEEGYHLIKNALEQSLQIFSNPLLFLSGGVDSRIILGLLRDLDYIKNTEAITWGSKPVQTGDDLDTAINLAKKSGIKQQIFHIETNHFQNYISQAINGVDCRVDILDAPALSCLWQSLGNNYDCFINGDEWFGWNNKVQSTDEAFRTVGIWGLDKAPRIVNWIHPDERKQLQDDLAQTLQSISTRTHTKNSTDQKDAIYYYERIGNTLNGQLVSKLPFIHPVRPLLDEDVVEFVSRIPQQYRDDKLLLRLILKHKYPDLDQLPYASCNALPTTAHLQKTVYQNQEMWKFLQKELFDNQNILLTSIIDFEKVKSIANALFKGSSLPPIKHSFLDTIPGLWRFLPTQENRVPPITGLFRILALNIYLNQMIDS